MSMFLTLPALAAPRPEERERPRARPTGTGPVLIGDCATAADHATLLLALWRRSETPPES